MAVIFYHCDADGRSAGAIVHKYIRENFPGTDERYIEIQYGQEEEILSSVEIHSGETIYVVDFHFSPEITERLWGITHNIFVFDHHKTTKEILPQYPKGVKCICDPSNKFAGCELVWNHLFPDEKMPKAIELIADRDKWAWKYGEETSQFNEGLKLYSYHPTDEIWERLFCDQGNYECIGPPVNLGRAVTEAICDQGKICLQYRDMICKEFRGQWGFEVEFEGYRCYVMNLILMGIVSEMFAEKLKEYDICIGLVYNGDFWKASLRSNGKVDVSEIAKKFKGGGHRSAAGFQCELIVVEEGKLKCL